MNAADVAWTPRAFKPDRIEGAAAEWFAPLIIAHVAARDGLGLAWMWGMTFSRCGTDGLTLGLCTCRAVEPIAIRPQPVSYMDVPGNVLDIGRTLALELLARK